MVTPVALEVDHIKKTFSDLTVLKDVKFRMQEGEFLCLLGPSGCGKSTLLRVLAGLESADSGKILWSGSLTEKAFVFQEAELLSWRTALENARLPLELHGTLTFEEQNKKALWALKRVGLEKFAGYFPHQLSGGMKMRVSIARALSSSPKVLFMDEPFSALDEITRFDLQKQLRNLSEEEKLTVIFVTHSSFEAAFLADRILLMSAKGGNFVLDQQIAFPQKREDSLRIQADYQSCVQRISSKMQESFV